MPGGGLWGGSPPPREEAASAAVGPAPLSTAPGARRVSWP